MPVAIEVAVAPLAPLLESELARVYADYPGTASPAEVLAAVRDELAAGATLYTGVFNARHIAAMLVCGAGETRHMRYLCVHDATRGRGVAERLLAEVRRREAAGGAHWLEADFDLTQDGVPEMLLALGFIPHEGGNYRCRLGE